MQLVRHWLRTCENEHNYGILSLPSSVPSMLLLLSEKHIHLVQTSDAAKARYAALSYCWGATRSEDHPYQADSTAADQRNTPGAA